MIDYNNQAFKSFNEKALAKCPNCGRTFLPDSLKIHLKSCNKAHGKAPDEGMSPPKPAFVKRPKTVMCYIW